jgi:hypothetical protein
MPELMDILSKAEIAINTEQVVPVPTAGWATLANWDLTPLARGSIVTPDAAAGSITVSEAGPYAVALIANVAFDRTEELFVGFSVNGADPAKWLAEQGRGARKPIDFSWYGIHSLNAGDVITVAARMESTDTDVSLLNCSFSVSKEF